MPWSLIRVVQRTATGKKTCYALPLTLVENCFACCGCVFFVGFIIHIWKHPFQLHVHSGIIIILLTSWESPVEYCYGWISEMMVHMCAFCLATWCGWFRFFHHRLLRKPMSSCDNNRYCDLFGIIEKQSTIATITTIILAFVQCRRWKPRSIREQDRSDLAKSEC